MKSMHIGRPRIGVAPVAQAILGLALWTTASIADSHVGFDVITDSREWPNASVRTLNYRVTARTQALGWSAGAESGWISASGRNQSPVSSLTDTRVFVGRQLVSSWVLRITADLPTGNETPPTEEIPLHLMTADALLDLPVRSSGSGLRLASGIGGTFSPALGWSVGLGAAWQAQTSLTPATGAEKFSPGNRLATSATVEHRAGDWTWRARGRWTPSSDATLGDDKVALSSSWGVDTTVLHRWERTSVWCQIGVLTPVDYEFQSGQFLAPRRGRSMSASVGGFVQVAHRLSMDGSFEHVRFDGQGPQNVGKSWRTEVHAGTGLRLDPRRSLRIDASGLRGETSVADERIPSGEGSWSGLQLRFGFRLDL